MKPGDAEYDKLVEGFRAKISGNISSVKMTEAETAKEIADITEGAFNAPMPNFEAEGHLGIMPLQPKRRGRPKGSRNKPKVK